MKNKPKSALICVDIQMDFIPVPEEDYPQKGGALAVPNGDEIIPAINWMIDNMNCDHVVFTGDLHPPDNIYFASQHDGKFPFDQIELNGKLDTLWPDHCVRNTPGSKFHPDLKIPENSLIFYKGRTKKYHPYSGFGNEDDISGLANFLNDMGVEEVYIVGLAADFCVKDTALDAVKEGFKTTVIEDGTRAIANYKKTVKLLTDAGVEIINLNEQFKNE